MKHLPFNHSYSVLDWNYGREYDDLTFTRTYATTTLTLVCACGRLRVKKIADQPLSEEKIAQYIEMVYL